MKQVYFISDAHLGSLALKHSRTQERRLVNFLDQIKHKPESIYLLGDKFDFWFEYKEVVPKGYTRFLGKLSDLTDSGVEVHYFCGNHDFWMIDYLSKECGVIIHRHAETLDLNGKIFYLAHGDGLDYRDRNWKTRLLFWGFHSKILRKFASMLPPDNFIRFGRNWAKHSRLKRIKTDVPQFQGEVRNPVGYESFDFEEEPYMGEDKEGLVLYAKDYLKTHPTINYFIFGHRHIDLDLMLTRDCRMVILGEWMSLFTYAAWDGEHLFVDNFVEGETEL